MTHAKTRALQEEKEKKKEEQENRVLKKGQKDKDKKDVASTKLPTPKKGSCSHVCSAFLFTHVIWISSARVHGMAEAG